MNLKLLVFLSFGCFLSLSCQKDSEKDSMDHTIVNDSWVTIINPGFLSPNPEAANVGLMIVYSSSVGKLVEVRAKIFPKSDRNNVVFDFKEKVDDDTRYTLSQSLNLSNFPIGTVFTVMAETDHNKSGTVVAKDSVDFSIR